MPTVLVTGGAGYVGSHCCKAFATAGWKVVVLDNLSRGWVEAIRWGPLVEADIADRAAVEAALDEHTPDLVAHFAAYAYVGESIEHPQFYYANNTAGTLSLLEAMRSRKLGRLLFSSTCATYGHPVRIPMDEGHPQAPINPYGWSKFIIERMLEDYARAYGFTSIILRYFNAAGADPEGEIGERHEPETHAIPLAIQAAYEENGVFRVYGTDFATRDGSAIRDYIHVSDLADAHVLAAQRLMTMDGLEIYNLGTGTGTSVWEMAKAVSRATGDRLQIEHAPRRPGDPAALVSAADRARKILGWTPERSSIDTIVRTAADWHRTGCARQ